MVGNMGTNCYLLADNSEIAIIDPGFEPERVLEEIEAIGLLRRTSSSHGS